MTRGHQFQATGVTGLQERVQPGDTSIIVCQDRLRRNFDEGVAIQADLTQQETWIVTIKENIDTRDGSSRAKFFRRIMLAQGAYQLESTSERIKTGLERARVEGRRPGRPAALTQEQKEECWQV